MMRAASPWPSTTTAAASEAHGHQPVILVVDDDDDVRQAICEFLADHFPRYRVAPAASGQQGLRIVRTQPVRLIISDHRMPGMSGVQFIDAARKLRPTVFHVYCTAFVDELLAELGPKAAPPVLSKPFEPFSLADFVARALAEPDVESA